MSTQHQTQQAHHEEKAKVESGTRSLQREAQACRCKIKVIREGHHTGGYVETEKLQEEEKHLDKILRKLLHEAKETHGYSPDPKFKHPEIRAIELELNGLSYKPILVAKEDSR